jgi:hypothetical protein
MLKQIQHDIGFQPVQKLQHPILNYPKKDQNELKRGK